jgi:CSLREA domain-containing protein
MEALTAMEAGISAATGNYPKRSIKKVGKRPIHSNIRKLLTKPIDDTVDNSNRDKNLSGEEITFPPARHNGGKEMKSARRTAIIVLFSLSIFALLLAACGPSTTALPCSTVIIPVTKTADTNDGICSSADCSLREAVIMSNTCPGTQTISIPAGTYTLSIAGTGEDAAATGDLDILDNAALSGTGNPVIDGGGADRVFEVFAGATVDMSGLIVQNGRNPAGAGIDNHGILRIHASTIRNNVAFLPPGGSSFANGGGILSEGDGALTLEDSEVSGNSADQGGGIMIIASGTVSPLIELIRTTVSNNSATASGGGLWLDNAVHSTLTRAQVLNNTAGDRGDGIYNASTLALNQSRLVDNHGGINGGGIYNEPAGDITARETLIQNNIARFGGGIYNKGPARFYQSLFTGNQAERGQGGAIYNFDTESALTIDNTTLSGNQAGLGGGAIRNDGGNFQINFATIALNDSEGINGSGAGEMTIRNSILADNTGGNCAGTLPSSIGFNIDSANTCGFVEPSDLVLTAPLLMPLALNGGLTQTHALDPASPAIDSADPDRCDGTDQRGVARPQGPRCDRGAYEFEGTPTPRATSTPTPTATATPTLAPSLTLGATSPRLGFLPPKISTDHFWYYSGACGPQEVQLQIGVSDPSQVFSLGLFVRSVEKSSGTPNAWSEGFAMSAIGGGIYSFLLPSTKVPGYNAFTEAWLQYQFVANDKGGNPILHSDVFSDITLSRCDKKQ